MKNLFVLPQKGTGLGMLVLVASLALPVMFGFSKVADDLSCQPPANVLKTGQANGAVSFSWDANGEASQYVLTYTWSDGNTLYNGPSINTSGTAYTFAGLAPGIYRFCLASACSGGLSGFIVTEDIIVD